LSYQGVFAPAKTAALRFLQWRVRSVAVWGCLDEVFIIKFSHFLLTCTKLFALVGTGLNWPDPIKSILYITIEQLLATDILVLATMKNAAKCDT
jgi:hypothetical protein